MRLNSEISSLDWRNGIVVRSPNWLGDAIMALPAMTCLKKALPEKCGFFVVCPDNLSPLYSSISWVSKIITTGSGHSALSKEKLSELSGLRASMGFLFVNSFRSAWYFRQTVPKVYGASNGLRNILLTRSFKVRWHEKKSYAKEHQSYKYLSMVYDLGCEKWDEIYPEFTLVDSSELRDKELISFLDAGKVLVIAPGAAYGPAKRWSASSYNEVCRYWIKERNGRVVIVGSLDEMETAESVGSGLDSSRILNLAGKTNLKELIYILKKSDMCISNDSGVMHLGSALDTKGVAVFGSTDPFSTGPLSKNWTVLLKKQTCSPCFSRECVNPEKNYKCLQSITPSDVIEAIEKLTSQ
jgi:heptosyltransferase-2